MDPPHPSPGLQTEQKRVLRHARHHLRHRRDAASEQFRRSLLVASNAVQASRMLHHLESVVQSRHAEQAADADELEADLVAARAQLSAAVRAYAEHDILDAESTLEHLTLSHDPMYLEGEEARRRHFFAARKNVRKKVSKVSWASNPSSRFVSLLRGDLEGVEEVTEEEQRSCISKCAWGFAILGMLIAICFLVVDFWQSQANPALVTKLIQNDKLILPTIYACISIPLIPTFEGLPNDQYNGHALWGLRSYIHLDSNRSLLYPRTNLIAEPAFLGRREYCTQALQYMSKEAIVNALDAKFDPARKCYSCLKVGAKTPIEISRSAAKKRPYGAVSLEFASTADIELCFNPHHAGNRVFQLHLKNILKHHGDRLIARNIVTIVGSSSFNFSIDHGFEEYDKAFPDNNLPKLSAETSLVCNLYFFSGYFFPVKPGTAIRYRVNLSNALNAWEPIGDKSNFLDVQAIDRFNVKTVNRSTIMAEMREEFGTHLPVTRTTVNIFSVDRPQDLPHAFKDFSVALRTNHRDVLLFTKTIESGQQRYSSAVQLGAEQVFIAFQRFRRYTIALDFSTMDTEDITRRPTTSTAEFLTDIFEYVGLFTGVCAYSVLVGPARMYLKNANKRHQHNMN